MRYKAQSESTLPCDQPKETRDYEAFLKAKIKMAPSYGFPVEESEVNPILKPHQRAIVRWAVMGGRRAIFAAFGLGKSIMQLETVRLTLLKSGKTRGLIIVPLGVRQEFKRDAAMLGITASFVRSEADAQSPGIYFTNYESVRDGKMNAASFDVVSLDEASCLRGFGGTKTFREFMKLFEGSGIHRYVATATPSPNEYVELLCYSAFLDIMDVSQAKTRFFKRDSTKADQLTIHPQHARDFWLWVASWAIFIQRPSDLGYEDTGYELPPLDIHWHELPVDHSGAKAVDKSGQFQLFRNSSINIQDAAREKRDSLGDRIAKMMEIRSIDPKAHRVIWHDLEDERRAIEHAVPEASLVSVYGSQDLDEREQAIIDFSDGVIQELAAKPVIAGSGCNFQRHCAWAIFLGIGFKFNDFIQAVHRVQRFLQTRPVRIDIIYTEAERKIRSQLERKWQQHKEMVAQMSEIIKEFGLSKAAMAGALSRALGVERIEVKDERYTIVNNDNVVETKRMETNSVGLILTSIPFSTQYEYSPNYADFGHTDDNRHFFQQMDFLTPELLRVLKPGRIAAIHVKDRVVPGGMTGLGFQTVYPFHLDTIEHFTTCPDCRARKHEKDAPRCTHRFAYMGMKTIVTDVVRENNQTYRLGWTEQCKDGTKMGVGVPEYLLLFRKPPTSSEKSYADEPVVKQKTNYTRSRWQIDAHAFARSSGNRVLDPEEVSKMPHEAIFKIFRDFNMEEVYNFEHHVALGEALEAKMILPVTFMLLQPPSWHPDVWTDITRMLTLNGCQHAKGKEQHLCPIQFDIADRVITQFSMEGETVFDPFGGLMTVPYRAILLKRRGFGIELNPKYFLDGAAYCKAAAEEISMPSLFDTLDVPAADPESKPKKKRSKKAAAAAGESM